MLGLTETMDKLTMANSVHCYVLRANNGGWSCLEKDIRFCG